MLKTIFSALLKAACLLPNKLVKLNKLVLHLLTQILNVFTQKFVILVSLLKKSFLKVLFLQFKPKSKYTLVIKPSLLIYLLAIFLFITPHTSVQANYADKVLPEPEVKASTIQSEIIPAKVPQFLAPVHGYLSTYFSSFHPGIDIPNPTGSPVAAAEEGEVVVAGWVNTGHGNLVIIRHNVGFETFYAHLSTILVSVGEYVNKGDLIGTVGSTGNSTGAHLHFEIHLNGTPQNPLRYITP